MCKKISAVVLSLMMLLSLTEISGGVRSEASSKNEGKAELRIYSTSDLHGQSITYSYDTASSHYNGSLAQIVSVMNEDKQSIKNGTSFLVDCGDTIFGLGAKATMSKMVSTDKQYMYELMKSMKYDAITLGNHDFDYGYDYEKSILESSGLDGKVVLANVSNAKTGKKIWATRKIIKKTVKTDKGKKKTVKVGVTGAVIPGLSTHATWKGILTTCGIVDAVDEQVDLLKEEGADVVIVLAHSGIGVPDEENDLAENVGYDLTKIDGVDVICLGHTHVNYPSADDSVQPVYSYPDVDPLTGMINGKVVIQEADHGQALGISSLQLSFTNNKVKVISKSAKLRKITQEDAEDPDIVEKNRPYDEIFKGMHDQIVMQGDNSYSNYFGMIQDNPLVQLSNDAKIAHAQKVVAEKAPGYAGYPIIASTTYKLAGGDGGNEYIRCDGNITMGDILNLQSFGQEWSKFYYLTGAQLREALEWQASAYLNPNDRFFKTWADPKINEYVQNDLLSPVLDPEWENWDGLTIFDGVEYTIDPTEPARYNRAGDLMGPNNWRVKRLTCNGVPVKDSQLFVWVNRNIAEKYWPMLYNQVKNQTIVSKTAQLTTVLEEYVNEMSRIGVDHFTCDDNWQVTFPVNDNYLIKSGEASEEEARSNKWFSEVLTKENGSAYYKARFYGEKSDDSGPLLSVAELEDGISGDPVEVSIQSSDRSGIQFVRYLKGFHGTNDVAWNNAVMISSDRFTVYENGIYSIKALDNRYNATVKYIIVENINTGVASTPKVNAVKNINKAVTGKASPGSTVYVETTAGVFNALAEEDGSFSCTADGLLADKNIYVWQIDGQGRISERVPVTVVRKGANKPVLDTLTNRKTAVTGLLNDSSYCHVIAVRGKKVYIPKGQKKKYKESKLYSRYKKKKIVETTYSYNSRNKTFALSVPKLYADQKLKICSYDWISRPSLLSTETVQDVAPNRPVIGEVAAQEGRVYGYVPEIKEGRTYAVKVSMDGETYTGGVESNGRFVVKTDSVPEGTKVSVTATDIQGDGEERESLARSTRAQSIFDMYSRTAPSLVYVEELDNKTDTITGYADANPTENVTLVIEDRRIPIELNRDGDFEYELTSPKKAGTRIGLMIRDKEGDIVAYRALRVGLAEPDEPWLMGKKIKETDKRIVIIGEDNAKGVLKIGSRYYHHTKKIKKREAGETYYYYVFKLRELKPGKRVFGYLKNKTGKSRSVMLGKIKKIKKKKEETEDE